MKIIKGFLVLVAIVAAAPAMAVAIDDTLTPQNCERSNPACAQFVDTTSVGQIKWGGLVAGGLRSLTNMFVDGKLGVGTLRPSTGEQVLKVDVEGAVGARYYCDENGNHCVRGDSLNQGGTSTANVLINSGVGINVTRNAVNNFTIAIDDAVTQRRVGGLCPVGQAIRTVNQDGSVVCQTVSGGATSTGDVTINNGFGILINKIANNVFNISVDASSTQRRVNGFCLAGQAISKVNQDGSVVCQNISGNVTNISSGPSIVVNRTASTTILTVNPDVVQFRITNTCPAGQAIRGVAADGTLTCQSVGAGAITISSGPSLVVNRSTTTNNYLLTVNPDVVQFRITNTCPAGQAIRSISANGTLGCQAVSGNTVITSGDSFWATTTGSNVNIFNRNLGKVAIGTDVPALAELTVKQRPGDLNTGNFSVAEFSNANNSSQIFLGRNGTGVESVATVPDTSAVYGYVSGARSTAVAGVSMGSGETYGAKFASFKVGTFSKGTIGIYATDMGNAATQSNAGRDNRIPAALASSGAQWAGYFDGNVNINGNLNIQDGRITINGQPISAGGTVVSGMPNVIAMFNAAGTGLTNSPLTVWADASSNRNLRTNSRLDVQGVLAVGRATVNDGDDLILRSAAGNIRMDNLNGSLRIFREGAPNGFVPFEIKQNGQLQIRFGTPQAGDVLTATDNNGYAEWRPATKVAQCRTCIRAYDSESNSYSAWSCSGYNGGESEPTGFAGSKSVEKVQVKMDCR